MGDWRNRDKKLAKRKDTKQMARAFKQDIKTDNEKIQRKKRQDIQAKIKEQDSRIGDVALED